MAQSASARSRFLIPAVVAAVLAIVAVVALVVGLAGQQSPPQPSADAASVPSTSSAAPNPAVSSAPPPPPSSATPSAPVDVEVAAPVAVDIPAISAESDLIDLGLNDDGTVEVPPLEDVMQAGWYENSPRPGAPGPALLLGHVDSAEDGPGIFLDLGALTPGDQVDVIRADGTIAVFTVDRVAVYPKAEFPTLEVYGNTPGPELRLITCGGAFNSSTRDYADNIVVYASLTGTRAA